MSIPFRALFFKRTSEPVTIDVAHEGEVYQIRLRGHPRARRYTLRIHSTTREVVLSMPPRGSVKQATEFARKHGAWIAARLQKLPKPAPFSHGTIIPLRGVDHRIEHRSGVRGTAWTEINAEGENLLCVAGAEPHEEQGGQRQKGQQRQHHQYVARGSARRLVSVGHAPP